MLSSFKKKEQKAIFFVEQMLSKYGRPYIACSFGKDSAVLAHLVLSVDPSCEIRFVTHPETRLLGNYDEILIEWKDLFPDSVINEIYLHRSKAKETRGNTQRDALESGNHDAFFCGLRAEESRGRRITLRFHGLEHKQVRTGVARLSPIAWWTSQDVLAYTAKYNLPILDKYKKEGVSARTTTGLPHNEFALGTIQYVRQNDPDAYQRLQSLYPDLIDLL